MSKVGDQNGLGGPERESQVAGDAFAVDPRDPNEGVPDDVGEDVPPGGAVPLVPEKDPEGDHRRGMDRAKLNFAKRLIFVCVGAVIALTLLQFLLQKWLPETAALNPAIDLAKLLATTALGFVFGRTLNSKDN